jgi:hypothetical protein
VTTNYPIGNTISNDGLTNVTHRRAYVLQKTIAGFSPKQIAEMYHSEYGGGQGSPPYVSVRHDKLVILRELSELHNENMEHWRAILLERYEILVSSLTPLVLNANLGAIDRYLKVLQQIGEISGANAPLRIEVENTTALSDEDRQRRIQEIFERARGRALRSEAEEPVIIDLEARATPVRAIEERASC